MTYGYTLRFYKSGSRWSGWVENPQGGGGSVDGKTRSAVIAAGLRLIQAGATYALQRYGEPPGPALQKDVVPSPCRHGYGRLGDDRGCLYCLWTEAERALEASRG